MIRRRDRRGAAAGLLTALVLLLSACATIPTDGDVHAGPTEAPDQPNVVFVPREPVPGAAPADIVKGFVNAASQGGDYSVARQFLTPDFAKRWDPSARVLVHDALWTTRATAPVTARTTAITLSVPVSARVEASGTYTPTPASQPARVPFQLTKVNGQWRISATQNGIVLAQGVFQRTFSPAILQFWDPSFTRLVPDRRWFPGPTLQLSAIVKALLAGAAAPLRGDVTASAFPSTGARVVSAGIAGGSALVSLRFPAEPSAVMLGRMWQQLERSLPAAADDLTLVVNGRTVQPVAQPRGAEPNPLPVVLAAGRFGALSASRLTEDAVLGKRVAALRPSAVTVSSGQRFAAVRTAKGVVVVTRTGVKAVDARQGLADPTVDQRGWTYSIPRDDPSGLSASSITGRAVSLHQSLSATRVLSIQASPDGTRMLVLQEAADGPAAFVYGIERSVDGTPTGLTSSRYPVVVGGDNALDATWVDDGSVAVLTQQSDGQTVSVTDLGGVTMSLGRLANATQLVGATSTGDLRARLNNGDVAVWRPNVWQSEFAATVDVDLLAVQR